MACPVPGTWRLLPRHRADRQIRLLARTQESVTRVTREGRFTVLDVHREPPDVKSIFGGFAEDYQRILWGPAYALV